MANELPKEVVELGIKSIPLKLKGFYRGVNAGEVAAYPLDEAMHILSQKLTDRDGKDFPAAEVDRDGLAKVIMAAKLAKVNEDAKTAKSDDKPKTAQ